MSERVTVDELTQAFDKILDNFKNATEEVCNEAIDAMAKEAVEELRNANPPGSGQYGSWDKYNKSWKYRKEKKKLQSTVYNEKYYRLTHLLEKGHALVNGGRTRAFPHIAPVAEKAEENLFKRVKDGI